MDLNTNNSNTKRTTHTAVVFNECAPRDHPVGDQRPVTDPKIATQGKLSQLSLFHHTQPRQKIRVWVNKLIGKQEGNYCKYV